MALDIGLFQTGGTPTESEFLAVGEQQVPLRFVFNRRARRYILRLQNCGTARITVPYRGSRTEARRFADRQVLWLERQLRLLAEFKDRSQAWLHGTEILFRGEHLPLRLEAEPRGRCVWLGPERIPIKPGEELRRVVESHLRNIAARELPERVCQLAGQHGFVVRRISVRNQRSRWGSCSARGTLALNWRLVQAPASVRDYIIIHELTHLRHMNHSQSFWNEVARLCPDYLAAEDWLKRSANLLR
jgi:predicted metal-dependent hydrolase